MGGRNAYSASSKSIETKDFKTLGFDGKLTYIQSIVNRAKDPVRSNSPNPIYVVVDSDGTARSLYFYKNHKVYKSIDLKHDASTSQPTKSTAVTTEAPYRCRQRKSICSR